MSFFDRFRKGPKEAGAPAGLSASQHTPRLVTRCLDQLALLYPHASHEIAVRARASSSGGMSIEGIDAAPVPSTEPFAEFPDDVAMRTALLGRSLDQLCRSVGMPVGGDRTFTAHATEDAIRILDTTFTGDGARLYDAAFFRALVPALHGGHAGFQARQEQFRTRFAEKSAGGLRWDRAAGTLALTNATGETSTVVAHILGSFAPSEQTWCWVWANSGLQNAQQTAMRALRDSNIEVLRQPGFDCTEPFSFAVAALAAHAIDPQLHVWRWPQRAQLFFAVRLEPVSS